jgi:hypothetical protein
MDMLGMRNGRVRIVKLFLTVGGVEVVGRSSGDLNAGELKGSGACPPSGDPHNGDGDQ